MNDPIRYASHPSDVKNFDTEALRARFLISPLFVPDEITTVYSMHDRMMTLGVMPVHAEIVLPSFDSYTKANYFLERRELGIINIGGTGQVTVDGETFTLENRESLYVGKGCKKVVFKSKEAEAPAEFYINSCPAHAAYPTTKAIVADANKVELGSKENCNERTIYQYIHEDGIESCQLVMGFTQLHPGSIWNTYPPHTHARRMEVYCYFDLPEDQQVIHLMGQPEETRHLVIRNKQAVISPEWSIHSGAGTSAYAFIWGMAGENKAFTDMDAADMSTFK